MGSDRDGVAIRAEAARTIHAVVAEGRSLDDALAAAEANLKDKDHALLRMLCFGSVRYYWSLAARVDGLLKRPLKRRDRLIHALLLVGVFQLTHSRVAPHAAVSLTVEAARLLRRPNLKALVNGLLRNALREAGTAEAEPAERERFDHPPWFIERLRADWPDRWQTVLEANNERAPMWLRVNKRTSTVEAYRQALAAELDIDVADSFAVLDGLDQGLRLKNPLPVSRLPGFEDGRVTVQDGAAQLAAPWLLAAAKGQRLLDACAAPGGKSGHLLELAGAETALTCVDAVPERAAMVEATLNRLDLAATVLVGDASKPNEWWDSRRFDGILLDAPCSASGVVRRHPDIKHLRRASDINRLKDAQKRLLDACWSMLEPGGTLLYVTCSVFAAENDEVVGYGVERHADMRPKNLLPNNNIRDLMSATTFGFQILPGTRGLDGFFYACLEKRTD